MTTWLFTHPACLTHEMGPHHPESPDRLRAILAALEAPEFEALVRREVDRPEDVAGLPEENTAARDF